MTAIVERRFRAMGSDTHLVIVGGAGHLLDDAEHRIEHLVEVLNPARSLSRHPLFQVMLAFEAGETGATTLELPGLAVTPQPIATASAKFDLSVGLVERRLGDGTPGGIAGVLEYASDLFDAATVETIGRRLIRLLEAAVADAAQPLGTEAVVVGRQFSDANPRTRDDLRREERAEESHQHPHIEPRRIRKIRQQAFLRYEPVKPTRHQSVHYKLLPRLLLKGSLTQLLLF